MERLNAGEVIVGDGGYVMQLEQRGYVKAGHWTPEAAVEHPEAGISLQLIYINDRSQLFLKVFLSFSVSAAAAQGVSESRCQCDSDIHLLLQ